jgi:GTP 3',8-cyclase
MSGSPAPHVAPGQPLVDTFGRVVTELRVSVTDRCNFRCQYCMPPEGLTWLAPEHVLTCDELLRVCGIFVRCGVDAIKLTGGEPLLRRDLPEIVRGLRALEPGLDLSLTTNGFLLERQAERLAGAGLDRVTVSCDSLLEHTFERLTLRSALTRVHAGIDAAARHGLTPIKLNAVVIRGVNDDEVVQFAELARRTGYSVRFIEYMPLDAKAEWSAAQVVPAAEIIERVGAVYPLRLAADERTAEPADYWVFEDGAPGSIGVIATVTDAFCDRCDRMRLTADGHVRACLFALGETDLRAGLRGGASDEELEQLVRSCVRGKWRGHSVGAADFARPDRSMSMIGG